MSSCYYDNEGCLICPERDGQAYIPASVERQVAFGWSAGANSIVVVDGDLHVVFGMPTDGVGAVIGLKAGRNQPTVPSQVEHGLYFQKTGGVNLVQPIERGLPLGAPVVHGVDDTFEIRRVDGRVTYRRNDTQWLVSERDSHGAKLVNCCLYASGDSAPSGEDISSGGGGGG